MKAAPEMVEISRGRSRRSPARSHERDKHNVSRERSIAPGLVDLGGVPAAQASAWLVIQRRSTCGPTRTPFLTGLRSTMPRFWALRSGAPLGRLA